MIEFIPYTYLIGWSKLDRWYYGRRTANRLPPLEDFWIVYRGSSKYVDRFIKEHGEPDVCEIRKTFKDRNSCYQWEPKRKLRNWVLMVKRPRKHNLPKGVNQNKAGRYYAQSKVDGKTVSLGAFDCPDQAHKAYVSFTKNKEYFFIVGL